MAWDPTIPADDELLINFPALCRANWQALEDLTDSALQITDAKIAASANISDTKLAQITTPGKVSGAALTSLGSIPNGAGVIPVANLPNKLSANSSDSSPEYLDGLINTSFFQIVNDKLEIKDGLFVETTGDQTISGIKKFMDRVGIGTDSPEGLLHVSAGTSGDAVVIIEADIDDDNENDNPRIEFKQDGGGLGGVIGVNGEADSAFSGAIANAFYLHNPTIHALQFAVNNEAKMTIYKEGDVYFGSYSKSTNGYTKLPNGLILQWCFWSGNISSGTYTFPIAFPNACLAVAVSHDNCGSIDIGVKNVTASSFYLNGNIQGQSNNNDLRDAYIIAIGY